MATTAVRNVGGIRRLREENSTLRQWREQVTKAISDKPARET
ncbi:hypothetical protein COO91_10958 (plasmid) [Nostoc flagelliforme CCNUN1]|jgi:hypothetical protein|uniref:Uncharacterized protein n=1 Tax=Nostoc flagelliforme CCNUN1 TaxID=2038116 RepID=A0A2K8TAJ0_9NOSO|nr:hypothetical protein COO91_10958 [Nostoc flagelliforme CCNUN1]